MITQAQGNPGNASQGQRICAGWRGDQSRKAASGIRNDLGVACRPLRHDRDLGQIDHLVAVACAARSPGRSTPRSPPHIARYSGASFHKAQPSEGSGVRRGVKTGLTVPGIAVAVPRIGGAEQHAIRIPRDGRGRPDTGQRLDRNGQLRQADAADGITGRRIANRSRRRGLRRGDDLHREARAARRPAFRLPGPASQARAPPRARRESLRPDIDRRVAAVERGHR